MGKAESQLISKIENIFVRIKSPGSISISVAKAHDSFDYKNDESLRLQDIETSWRDVHDEKLSQADGSVFFFNENSWLFYLPALMSWYLRKYKSEESRLFEELISVLGDQKSIGFLKKFTQAELECVKAFLVLTRSWMVPHEREEFDLALDNVHLASFPSTNTTP